MKKSFFSCSILLTVIMLTLGCSSSVPSDSREDFDDDNYFSLNNGGGYGPSDLGQFTVALHDEKPKDGTIEEIELTVSSVEISDEDGGWTTISKGTSTFDLLKLIDGAEAVLAESSLSPGTYGQIRLHLGADPRVKVDGNWEPLSIPSADQTGVKLSGPFEIRAGYYTRLVLDMNPDENVHYIPGSNEWKLKPSIDIEAVYIGYETSDGEFQSNGGYINVSQQTGGTISLDSGTVLEIPAGAVDTNAQLGMEEINADYPVFMFLPEGQTFSEPVSLTTSYADFDFPEGRGPEDIVFLLNGESIPVSVNAADKTITVSISHFSTGMILIDGDIFLTFDDGPMLDTIDSAVSDFMKDNLRMGPKEDGDEETLSDLLDALKSKNKKGTFFQVGWLIDHDNSLTSRLLKEGNIIGNHTYWHDIGSFADGTTSEIRSEIEETNLLIRGAVVRAIRELVEAGQWEATNYNIRDYLVKLYVRSGTPLFRSPGGRVDCTYSGRYNVDALSCALITDMFHAEEFFDLDWLLNSPMQLAVYGLNMGIFNWDEDTKDWNLDNTDKEPGDLVAAVDALELDTGDVVLMHERRITADAMTDILDNLKERGFNPKPFNVWPQDGLGSIDPALKVAETILEKESPPEPSVHIVDDLDSGFTRKNTQEVYATYWKTSYVGYPLSAPHMYYVRNNGPASDGSTSTAVLENIGEWKAGVDETGYYKIEAFIPKRYASTKTAKYEIYDGEGNNDCVVDQSVYFDEWIDLGTYRLLGTDADRVLLGDVTEETDNTVYVGYDALRFTLSSETSKRAGDDCR